MESPDPMTTGFDEDAELNVAFWIRELAGTPIALELPKDHTPPPNRTGATRAVDARLPHARVQKARDFAASVQAEPSQVFRAVFAAVLARYSHQMELVFGTVTTPKAPSTASATIPCRIDVSDDPSFSEVVARIRDSDERSADYHRFDLSKLAAELGGQDPSRHPVYQATFEHVPFAVHGIQRNGASGPSAPAGAGTSSLDLALKASEKHDGLVLRLEYASELYEESSAHRMLEHFETLLDAALANPELKVSELPLLGEREIQELALWNRTDRSYPKDRTLYEILSEKAKADPKRAALVHRGQETSYEELYARANKVARLLQKRGVGPGKYVAICLEDPRMSLIAMLGTLSAGGAYLPIDAASPRAHMEMLLKDSGATVVLTEQKVSKNLPEIAKDKLVLLNPWPAELDALPNEAPSSGARPRDPAYVIYTSGSTGTPKGVVILNKNVVNQLHARIEAYVDPPVCFLLLYSFSFDSSVAGIFWTLATGGRIVLLDDDDRRDPRLIRENVKRHRVEYLDAVPSMYALILDGAKADELKSLRLVVLGGEALPRPVAEKHWALLPQVRLYNEYGPTEAAVFSTVFELPKGQVYDRTPIGSPIGNTRCYVLDDKMRLVPIGHPGELYVGGENVSPGYMNRPELTKERFLADPFRSDGAIYKTGDVVRQRPDGLFEFIGRSDRQVKVRGFRIELGAVEAALERIPGIERAAVLHRKEAGDDRLDAYVASPGSKKPTAADLRSALERDLPVYMMPASFSVLDSLPLTPNGKVDFARLSTIRGERGTDQQQKHGGAPDTNTQRVIAEVWGRALDIPVAQIGIDDDFFSLGGHSLLAVRMMNALGARFGKVLPLNLLRDGSTVRELASFVELAPAEPLVRPDLEAEEAPGIPRVARKTDIPPSTLQGRLWDLWKLKPSSSEFILAKAFRLVGPLDVEALKLAFERVAERHQILQSRIREADGRFSLEVGGARSVQVSIEELAALGNPDAAIRDIAKRSRREPFNLTSGAAPIRVKLIRVADGDYGLVVILHQMLSDCSSLPILWRDLSAFYGSTSAPDLPPLPIQFGDYAEFEVERLSSPWLQRELEYWRAQIGGKVPQFDLPRDFPGSGGRGGGVIGENIRVLIDRNQTARLRKLCRAQGLTMYMALLGAFQALLGHAAGVQNVWLGTAVGRRNHAELIDLIGPFSGMLPVRGDISGDPTFVELLKRARGSVLDILEHQELPIDRLIGDLDPARVRDGAPFFDAEFLLQEGPKAKLRFGEVVARDLELRWEVAHTPLALRAEDTEDGVVASFVYDSALFERDRIEKFAFDFRSFIADGLARPEDRISNIRPFARTARRETAGDRAGGGSMDLPAVTGDLTEPALPAPAKVPPRNDVERRIAKIWEEILRVSNIGVHDNFLDLGGNSARALALSKEIAQDFDKGLPLATIFLRPTVAELAEVLGGGAPGGGGGGSGGAEAAASEVSYRALTPLHTAGNRPPMFFVGSVGYAHAIAVALGPDQPIYGLNIFGLQPEENETPSMELDVVARQYNEEIRRVQPKGPYHLVGYCADAKLAWEMAVQLRAAGEQVGLLGMIDLIWQKKERSALSTLLRRLRAFGPLFPFHALSRKVKFMVTERLRLWLGSWRHRFGKHKVDVLPAEIRNIALINAYLAALEAYEARPYDGPVTSIMCREVLVKRLPQEEAFQARVVNVREVSGYHDNLFNKPQVYELATILRHCQDEVAKSGRP